MKSRLERIEREIAADADDRDGLDYADAEWLVDLVKAYQVYMDATELHHLSRGNQRRFGEMFSAQKALGDVENRK